MGGTSISNASSAIPIIRKHASCVLAPWGFQSAMVFSMPWVPILLEGAMQPSLEKLSKALLRVSPDVKGLQNNGLKPGLGPKTDFSGEGPAKR